MQRAGRSIFHSPGAEELFARATCKPRSRGEPLSRARTQVRVPRGRAATPRQPPVQLECSLYRFPFCSPSHFSTLILSTRSSRSCSLLSLFPPLSRTRRRLRYFFIMHTFAGAIAISFGLVSALSARKSIFTVAEHQRESVGSSLSLSFSRKSSSKRKSRAAINSLLKRNRSPSF